MGATPYKAVSFEPHEVVTRDKLNQVQTNMQWLIDNTPRARYIDYHHNNFDVGTTLLSGRVLIPRNKYSHHGIGHVRFGSAFEPGYLPNLATTVCSDQKLSVHCTTRGMNGLFNPDYRGFDIEIYVPDIATRPAKVRGKTQKDKPDRAIYVFWEAVGVSRKS